MRLVGLAVFAMVLTVATAAQQAQQSAPQNAKPSADNDLGATRVQGNVEVLTDTEGVDFGPYLSKVLKTIRTNWYALMPAKAKKPELTSGKASIEFAILPDGKVAGMKIIAPSGDVSLDRAAWDGITASNPFSPLPSEFHGPYLALRFHFYYNLEKTVPIGSNRERDSPAATQDANTLFANASSAHAMNDCGNAIPLAIRVTEMYPQHNGAWNLLGLCYLELDELQKAEDAFKRQIEVSPQSPFAYNNLGRVYARQRKFDMAIAQFRKQIEINPRDRYAHMNLAESLRSEKKCDQAIPEYQLAAELTPENAGPHVGLARCYLDLGQQDSGIAELDKAAALTSSGPGWDALAWTMAKHQIQLDRAEQYARLAVSMDSSSLIAVSLDPLTPGAYGRTRALSAAWDILGWILLLRGDFTSAEKYITASWTLSRSPTVSDHLAQLAEKLGRKDDAVKYSTLAVAGGQASEAQDSDGDAVSNSKARLVRLAPSSTASNQISQYGQQWLQQQDSFVLPNPAKHAGSAEFSLLRTHGQSSAKARWMAGDPTLKDFESEVAARMPAGPADVGDIDVLRWGTLSCEKSYTECKFRLSSAREAVNAQLRSTVKPATAATDSAGPATSPTLGSTLPPSKSDNPPEHVQVAQGTSQGMLISKVQPSYPPLARQARVQGTVVLHAVIGKDGSVQNLTVISGHPMLTQAALDAVKRWRYKPYLLNGEPVLVETTIDVNFALSGAPKPSPDYSQEAFVTEHYIESFRFENDGTGRQQIDGRIKINSESGVQRFGQLKMGYSALSDKLEVVYVRVIKPDGTIINAPESGMQDVTYPNALMYSDYHEKHISVPSLRPGDVLEYQFVRTIVNPFTPGQFWTNYDFNDHDIVLDGQLEINVPKARQIKLKTEPGIEPKVTDEGDRRIYRWKHSNLEDEEEAAKKNKKTPPRPDADKLPAVQLTTFESWQQVGDWYAGLEKDRRQPNDAIKAKAGQLVAGKTTDMEKVQALYDFVSRDFRYVSLSLGMGRYQPHAASEVFTNGYGDCKDKNTLLAALLDTQGIESTSVLIGSQHRLDPDIPSPLQFDHAITRVLVDGQEIWLDSTSGVATFRMLGFSLRDKQALAMPPGGTPGLVTTPANPPFENYNRDRLEGSLNDTGKLTAHLNVTARGDSEMILRFSLRQIPNNKWKDTWEAFLTATPMKGGEITNLKVSDLGNTDKPIELDFDVAVSNYFDWAAPDPKLPVPAVGMFIAPAPDDESKNPKPIKLGPVAESSFAAKIGIPAKYAVHLPIGVDVKRDYAEYHSSYKFEGSQLVASRKVQVLVSEIPYDRRDDYAAFRRTFEADLAQTIALDNKSPGTAGLGANQSPDELFESAKQAGSNNNFELAIDLLQRVAKADPKHKDLWHYLGLAYLATNQNEQAIVAFKKEIELNPYDGTAYALLGLAYEAVQRYDDAIAQYQKQIEVDPLGANAHGALGELYSKLKRWNDAVPELEKAASLQAKNPGVHISLGEAYVATGQTDKGMASFDRAIVLSPSADVWNGVAYSLAQQNVQLDRASQYADSAINALETQLRDVNLDSLRPQDIAAANSLYNVWDTKGWVEFKRGNLSVAERYIRAAWQEGGSGEESLHMGEIAEKRGNKDEAIRYYTMALAGHAPIPEARPRLAALGVSGDLGARIEKARSELKAIRTRKLNASGKGTGDFFVLATPAKIEQVRFVSGDTEVRAMAEVVKTADLEIKFPDPASVRALRRGTVTCGTVPPPPASTTQTAGKKGAKANQSPPAAAKTEPPAKLELLPGPCSIELMFSDAVRSID